MTYLGLRKISRVVEILVFQYIFSQYDVPNLIIIFIVFRSQQFKRQDSSKSGWVNTQHEKVKKLFTIYLSTS